MNVTCGASPTFGDTAKRCSCGSGVTLDACKKGASSKLATASRMQASSHRCCGLRCGRRYVARLDMLLGLLDATRPGDAREVLSDAGAASVASAVLAAVAAYLQMERSTVLSWVAMRVSKCSVHQSKCTIDAKGQSGVNLGDLMIGDNTRSCLEQLGCHRVCHRMQQQSMHHTCTNGT